MKFLVKAVSKRLPFLPSNELRELSISKMRSLLPLDLSIIVNVCLELDVLVYQILKDVLIYVLEQGFLRLDLISLSLEK